MGYLVTSVLTKALRCDFLTFVGFAGIAMSKAFNRTPERQGVKRRFGTEIEVEQMTGFSRRTLQKDRLLRRSRFPWYKIGRKVLYDMEEVEAVIRRNAR